MCTSIIRFHSLASLILLLIGAATRRSLSTYYATQITRPTSTKNRFLLKRAPRPFECVRAYICMCVCVCYSWHVSLLFISRSTVTTNRYIQSLIKIYFPISQMVSAIENFVKNKNKSISGTILNQILITTFFLFNRGK